MLYRVNIVQIVVHDLGIAGVLDANMQPDILDHDCKHIHKHTDRIGSIGPAEGCITRHAFKNASGLQTTYWVPASVFGVASFS